jgi:hypothetical protein
VATSSLEVGTRDLCRHCGRKIILLSRDSKHGYLRTYKVWTHMTPKGGHKDECPASVQEKKQYWQAIRAEPQSYCQETMHRAWHSEVCERPVKDKVNFLCGIHAAHARKAAEKKAKRKEKSELTEYMKQGLDGVRQHLSEEFGLETKNYYHRRPGDWEGHYTGEIIVDATALLKLLVEMRDEERF